MTKQQPPHLLRVLINSAEKASNIARICRSNDKLLELLVEEKTGGERNARFEHDFKTLADVLIQETIKNDVGTLFPSMRNAINGEESPHFTNAEGESVVVCVNGAQQDTANILGAVLRGNRDAAEVLAAEVHRDVVYDADEEFQIPELPADLDYAKLGIWIDPIDATAEYISGESVFTNFPGISSTGLDCVTVLIGVYDLLTGEPMAGVISQPFHRNLGDNIYKSKIVWGVALPHFRSNNCDSQAANSSECFRRTAIFSSSENADLLQNISKLGYEFVFSAGAGHKALKVITGEVDLYLLSKGSTFKWDTCAPQAILRSLGGDVFNFAESVRQGQPIPLNYLDTTDDENINCNKGGLIALRDSSSMGVLLENITL